MSIAAMKQALEALELGQDAFSQTFGGYGYYRPDNPHNFFPDPECCTEKEIAHHSAACEAYDKGTYVPDHSDGWITPELHVTKAPWGIGTYTDECKEITEAITALRAAIAEQEKCEPDCFAVLTPNGSKLVSPQEAKGLLKAYPLYTHPQPIPDGCKNDAARWNFVMATEPYALNLWNALPKNIYQQERHLNTAIDQAMLAAAPKEKS